MSAGMSEQGTESVSEFVSHKAIYGHTKAWKRRNFGYHFLSWLSRTNGSRKNTIYEHEKMGKGRNYRNYAPCGRGKKGSSGKRAIYGYMIAEKERSIKSRAHAAVQDRELL